MDPATNQLDDALARLHRHHDAVLRIGDRVEPIRFVIDPVTGRPVFPAPPGALQEETVTLHAPEDADDALHLMGALVELDPGSDGACDRYLIYFERAPWARWAAMEIESLKNLSTVLDGPEAMVVSPLRGVEPGICKRWNADPARVTALCRKFAGVAPDPALLVGVDPYGLDVRARFGIVRIEFTAPAKTPEAIESTLASLVNAL
jgi:hypothetical protein